MNDDVCNTRQVLEELLKEYDINAVDVSLADSHEKATIVKDFHIAISCLREIELLTAI